MLYVPVYFSHIQSYPIWKQPNELFLIKDWRLNQAFLACNEGQWLGLMLNPSRVFQLCEDIHVFVIINTTSSLAGGYSIAGSSYLLASNVSINVSLLAIVHLFGLCGSSFIH